MGTIIQIKSYARHLILAFVIVLITINQPASAQTEPGKWAFAPAVDQFSPDALLDLRSLNEKTAGESGFVKLTPDGNAFALGNGQPVRFWSVTDYVQNLKGPGLLEHHARWLAKRGVNMVRFHGNLQPTQPGSKITDVNREELDHVWKLVAAMKKEGIYTTISPYWAIPVKIQQSWGIPGGTDQSAAGLLFWDKTLQEGYKAWMKALFTQPNPYTGIPLAQEPAVALIQLQNEDSMLFWTMQNVKGDQKKEVETLFGDWLNKKYGSLDKAKQAWAGVGQDDDDFTHGVAGIFPVWEWTQRHGGGKAKRLDDQLQFFGETMHTFNADMAAYLHDQLGCKQLINAGNWRTADPVRLMDVERWSYTANDVIAVNRYFTGVHYGPHGGWAIEPHDHFTNISALLEPAELPVNFKQVVGHPSIVSESQWVSPGEYQSEGPFLVAAYSSLTGVDSFYWFCIGDVPEWQQPRLKKTGNFLPPMGQWAIATPEQLGQFPAAALLFRRGYVEQGKPAVHEERSLEDLWTRRVPIIAEEGAFDPNRDAGDIAERSSVTTRINPLAFLVGPVEVVYGGDAAKNSVIDLSKYLDIDHKTITSDTGQLKLDYNVGLCTLNAPAAQGVTGFLSKAGGDFKLNDVEIKSGNDYATCLVVAMDDKPIAQSGKVLIQIGTVARPTGWSEQDADFQAKDKSTTYHGKEILSTGRSPWQITDTDAMVTVKNPTLKSATLLDLNGNAVAKLGVTNEAGTLSVKLPANAMYVVLQ